MEYLQLYPTVSYDVGRMPAAASIASPRLVAQAQARLGTTAPPMLARRHSHRELASVDGGRRVWGGRERPSPPPASPCLSSSLPEGEAAPLTVWGASATAAAATAAPRLPPRSAAGRRAGLTTALGGGRCGGGGADGPAAAVGKGKTGRSTVGMAAAAAATATAAGSAGPNLPMSTAPSPRSVLGLPPRPEVPAPVSAAAIAGRACENCGQEHLRLADAVEDCIFRQVFCSAECYWSERFRREEAARPRGNRH